MPRKPADLTGQTFGNLTVIEITDQRNAYHRLLYRCRCTCGAEVLATMQNLKRGWTKSCPDCLSSKLSKDITGQRYGRLTALHRAGKPTPTRPSYSWLCQCDCGKKTTVRLNDLASGNTTSCGCAQADAVKALYVDGTAPMKLSEGSRKPRSTNTSGVTGVWYNERRGLWTAEIMLRNKNHFLGRFADKAAAIAARKRAEEKLFAPVLEKYPPKNADNEDKKE